jgi:SAM-dependent methyltransferase
VSLAVRIRKLLTDPRLAGMDYDDGDRLAEVHRRILSEKPLMRAVFGDFYGRCRALDDALLSGEGLRVELGAGVSILKQFQPDVLCTDVKPTASVELVVDAQAMPFADRSVRAFYALNCFHHFPEPERFFAELLRVLVPGGGCVLVEPYHGPVARWFYARLFDQEGYDLAAPAWSQSGAGVMNGANQALSYVVFVRDAERFRREFPGLEVAHAAPLTNHVRYLASGGLNFRSLVPAFAAPALRGVEALLAPAARLLALHHVVVLRRRADGA